jgi:hypothetical protein
VPALVVAGDGLGTLKWMALDDYYARQARGGGNGQGAGGKPKAKSLAERKTALLARRTAWILGELRKKHDIRKMRVDDFHHEGDPHISLFDCLAVAARLAIVFGTANHYMVGGGDRWKRYAKLEKETSAEELAVALWNEVSEVLWHRLSYHDGREAIRNVVEIDGLCSLLGIDKAALEAGAEKAIPTPKSWANLKADGTPKTKPKPKAKKKTAKTSTAKNAKDAKDAKDGGKKGSGKKKKGAKK